jgi:hypothetical protein
MLGIKFTNLEATQSKHLRVTDTTIQDLFHKVTAIFTWKEIILNSGDWLAETPKTHTQTTKEESRRGENFQPVKSYVILFCSACSFLPHEASIPKWPHKQ